MYSFHLIPIYNRAQFVDKTDPCCSTSRRQRRMRTGAAMECHQDITPETPSLAPAGVAHACLYSPWECRAWGIPHCLCCQTGIRQIESESASLVRAVKGRPQGLPTTRPGRLWALSCLQWSCTAFRWASEGRYRPYPPSDQRVCHRHRWRPYYTAMSILPLKRRTDSAPAPPGAPGLSWGYRDWKGNTVLDGHYEAPCSPQIFRSSLKAFPVRSWLMPKGGALCRFYALCGCVEG